MKRLCFALTLAGALGLCLLTGCAGPAGNGTEVAANSGSGEGIYHAEMDAQEETTEDGTETEEFISPFAGRQEEFLDLSEAKLDDFGEASSSSRCVSNGNGYFFVENRYLKFYDLATETAVPVCNRANCMHDDYDCNAYVGRYSSNVIGYWDGYIYMPYIGDGSIYLARVSEDGSTQEDEYMVLSTFSIDEDGSWHTEIPEFCVCQGYVYYDFDSESTPKVRRMELGGSDAEVVYTSEGVRAGIWNLQSNGDYLFFEVGNFTDESQLYIEGGIMAYNSKTGVCSLVKNPDDGVPYDFCVHDKALYYELETGIYKKSLIEEGGQEFVMDINTVDADIHVSDNVLYGIDLLNYSVMAYSLDGEKLAQVTGENLSGCCWVDGINIYGTYALGMSSYNYLLNLSDFLAGSGEWVKI